jgi:hypothetical protein
MDFLAQNAINITSGTIGSLISTAIVVVLAIFWHPFREMCDAIRKWVTLMVKNPRLNVRVELGATLESLPHGDFVRKIVDGLNSMGTC